MRARVGRMPVPCRDTAAAVRNACVVSGGADWVWLFCVDAAGVVRNPFAASGRADRVRMSQKDTGGRMRQLRAASIRRPVRTEEGN